jgi:hypothetical protein
MGDPNFSVLTEEEATAIKEAADELTYLRFFFQEADFGPADGDVRAIMNETYVEMGNIVPEGY